MKKRILSCLMALALCLTLLPTAALAEETEGTAQTSPAMEEAADPANGEAKQENQPAAPEQENQPAAPEQEGQSAEAKQESQSAEAKQENQPAETKQESQPAEAKQENQPAEQEEQQEDSAAKQAVAEVQAMIDALPDAADLDGMDDAEAMEVYEAFQTACEAYYDTLSEKQQAQLKNTEKLEALSERFSQLETLAAGDTHTHCVCGKSVCAEKDHDNKITFGKWLASSDNYTLEVAEEGDSYATGLNPESGKYVLPADKYYLQGNVTIKYPILIKGDVTICLNGKTIQSTATDKPVFEVVSGGKLTLTDCGSTGKVTRAYNGTGGGVEVNGGEFNLYSGKITGNTAAKGGGVKVTSGTVNMYGGAIADNKAAGSAEGTGNGGGVYMSGGTFHMRGGSITDNTTEVSSKGEGNGGGVYVSDGEFNLYGGSITNNKVIKYGGQNRGGGVHVGNYGGKKGTFNMSGGEISDNEAKDGGGVYVYDGTFTMSGGKITGNTATSLGGGVRVDSNLSSTFTMSGGEISGNNKASSGGGVSVETGTFNMSGGKITGNTATKYGGGVHMLHGNFTVSGTAVIKDNRKGTAANNVHLFEDKFITVNGALADGASIGVTTKSEPAAGGSVIAIGKDLTDKDAEKFKSDLGGYAVSVNESKNGLLLVKAHTHYLCGEDSCNKNGHTCHAVTFTAWTDRTKLPETKGKYYLDTDVTLTETWRPADGTVLCLNGHNITMNGNKKAAIYVINAFTLCDCKGGKDAYGQITHATGKTGSGVYVSGNGRFYMYGGSISNNTTNLGDNGGGVYMAGGQFTMYGGSITKNTAKKDSQNNGGTGGGVYVNSGTFDMNGNASVSDNTATKNGGGVYVGGGTFTMNDTASVKDNTASGDTADQGNGGGVYVKSGEFNMNGNASVSGNTATNTDPNNTTYGGGVYVHNGTFDMNGDASVSGNTAKNGGGVHVSGGGKFNMNGDASITGNTANGVCVSAGATFTVSGEPTVTGNTGKSAAEDDASNVYLNGGAYITIGKNGLTDGASIGVTKKKGVDNGVIAKNVSTDYSGKFFSDDKTREVKYKDNQLVLAEKDTTAETHTHCLCGKTHTAIGDHKTDTQITFDTKLWMDNGVLKKGNGDWTKGTVNRADGGAVSHEGYVLTTGSYYLDDNLTLNGAAILIDGDVKLCLNGHTIDRANGNAALDYVIWVLGENNAHLTLTDCVGGGTIKGGGNGGVDIFGFCTLDMFGGTITGNTNSGVNVGQFGEFNMYGGKITGNSAGFGGGVYNGGTVNMYGGEIRGNTASNKGGGVYMAASMGNYQGGILNVSGAAKITGNTVNGTACNVYLPSGKTITIGGALTGEAGSIGVTTEPKPAAGTPVTVIADTTGISGLTTHVVSDDNAYATAVEGSTIVLKVKGDGGGTPAEHIHNWTYRANGATITATCTNTDGNCGDTNGGSVTIKAPTNLTYDGTVKHVTVERSGNWQSAFPEFIAISYHKLTTDGSYAEMGEGPTVVGKYKASTTMKGETAFVEYEITGGTTPSQPSNPGGSTGGGGSSSGGGGGSSSDRDSSDSNPVIKTETKNNPDGSTTKTDTRRDGSMTQTTTGKDGSVTKTETKPDGSSVTENKAADGSTGTIKTDKNGQTEANAKVSAKAVEDAKKSGEAVKAPVEVKASRDSSTAPTVKVELPKGTGETKVEIPVSNVKPGTVAVLVHPDGTEEILKDSIPTEDGIQLTVNGNATVKIVDNSKGFIDTRNHWAEDEIDFVSARGLVNGMSATIYAPNASTTRAQLWTILARQNDADLSGGNIWYEKAQNWAKDKGVSDGANPNAAINRAQMVTMLWRAVGQPAPATAATFTDVSADAYYAGAVSWAVENGITTGVGGGKFDPTGACTRAQIAAFLTRLYAEK